MAPAASTSSPLVAVPSTVGAAPPAGVMMLLTRTPPARAVIPPAISTVGAASVAEPPVASEMPFTTRMSPALATARPPRPAALRSTAENHAVEARAAGIVPASVT